MPCAAHSAGSLVSAHPANAFLPALAPLWSEVLRVGVLGRIMCGKKLFARVGYLIKASKRLLGFNVLRESEAEPDKKKKELKKKKQKKSEKIIVVSEIVKKSLKCKLVYTVWVCLEKQQLSEGSQKEK